MKTARSMSLALAAFLLGTFAGAAAAQGAAPKEPAKAPSARQQFEKKLEELKADPGYRNLELRKEIIKLSLSMKPKPAVPEEVIKLAGKAAYIMKDAKSEADFTKAALAYGEALALAPWKADYYFNQAIAFEKGGFPAQAIDSLRLYLLAAPDAADKEDVLAKLGGLEYAAEQKAQAEAAEAQERRRREEGKQAVDEMKRLYGSFRSSRMSLCCPGGMDGGCSGCTKSEYYENNWYKLEMTEDHVAFEFPEDGTVNFTHFANTTAWVIVRGTPRGPALSDIYWECPDKSKAQTGRYEVESWKPGWVETTNDGKGFTVSCDAAAGSGFNDNVRYHYEWYK